MTFAGSSNGRTTDSESVYLGSNPGPAAMNWKDSKENLETLSRIVALFLALSYGLGFLLWNIHLNDYGYFEYDLLQTRFILSGIVTILLFVIPFSILIHRLLGTQFLSRRSNFIKIVICGILLIVTGFLFVKIIFPWIPQPFGGARPLLKSIIAESSEIEFLSNFNIPAARNADGKSSVQTSPVCEIYSNRDLIIIGTIGESGLTLRVLNIRKDKIKGFQTIAPFEEERYRKIICAKFFFRIFE